MADFYQRRQYIGVYLYFELLFIPKMGYTVINLANLDDVCTLYAVPNLCSRKTLNEMRMFSLSMTRCQCQNY